MSVNATIRRFGHPETMIAEYRHWIVLLRPDQPTLGSLVVAAKSEATAFADLPEEAFEELKAVVGDVEATLRSRISCEKINYLMLMMVDPHVHWHVIPRYPGTRASHGVDIADAGWPKAPQLAEAVTLTAAQVAALGGWLREGWPAARR